jgi:hypothetical protein
LAAVEYVTDVGILALLVDGVVPQVGGALKHCSLIVRAYVIPE